MLDPVGPNRFPVFPPVEAISTVPPPQRKVPQLQYRDTIQRAEQAPKSIQEHDSEKAAGIVAGGWWSAVVNWFQTSFSWMDESADQNEVIASEHREGPYGLRPQIELATPPEVSRKQVSQLMHEMNHLVDKLQVLTEDEWSDNRSVEANLARLRASWRGTKEELTQRDETEVVQEMKRRNKLSREALDLIKPVQDLRWQAQITGQFDRGVAMTALLVGAVRAIAIGAAGPATFAAIAISLGLTVDQAFSDVGKKCIAELLAGGDKDSEDSWNSYLHNGSTVLLLAAGFGVGGYHAGAPLLKAAVSGTQAIGKATATITEYRFQSKDADALEVASDRQRSNDQVQATIDLLSQHSLAVIEVLKDERRMEERRREAFRQVASVA